MIVILHTSFKVKTVYRPNILTADIGENEHPLRGYNILLVAQFS